MFCSTPFYVAGNIKEWTAKRVIFNTKPNFKCARWQLNKCVTKNVSKNICPLPVKQKNKTPQLKTQKFVYPVRMTDEMIQNDACMH